MKYCLRRSRIMRYILYNNQTLHSSGARKWNNHCATATTAFLSSLLSHEEVKHVPSFHSNVAKMESWRWMWKGERYYREAHIASRHSKPFSEFNQQRWRGADEDEASVKRCFIHTHATLLHRVVLHVLTCFLFHSSLYIWYTYSMYVFI